MDEATVLRTISVAHMCGKIDTPETPRPVCRIYGIANRTKSGNSQFGPWVKLVGQFEGVNMTTGEVFISPYAILPDKTVNDLVAGQIESGQTGVEFAYEFGVKPSKSPVGYDYTTKVMVKEKESDALIALRGKLPPLSLPSPKKK